MQTMHVIKQIAQGSTRPAICPSRRPTSCSARCSTAAWRARAGRVAHRSAPQDRVAVRNCSDSTVPCASASTRCQCRRATGTAGPACLRRCAHRAQSASAAGTAAAPARRAGPVPWHARGQWPGRQRLHPARIGRACPARRWRRRRSALERRADRLRTDRGAVPGTGEPARAAQPAGRAQQRARRRQADRSVRRRRRGLWPARRLPRCWTGSPASRAAPARRRCCSRAPRANRSPIRAAGRRSSALARATGSVLFEEEAGPVKPVAGLPASIDAHATADVDPTGAARAKRRFRIPWSTSSPAASTLAGTPRT